jgi:hypothetical protein
MHGEAEWQRLADTLIVTAAAAWSAEVDDGDTLKSRRNWLRQLLTELAGSRLDAALTRAVVSERVHAVVEWRRHHHVTGLDAGLLGPRPADALGGAEWDRLNSSPAVQRADRQLDIA